MEHQVAERPFGNVAGSKPGGIGRSQRSRSVHLIRLQRDHCRSRLHARYLHRPSHEPLDVAWRPVRGQKALERVYGYRSQSSELNARVHRICRHPWPAPPAGRPRAAQRNGVEPGRQPVPFVTQSEARGIHPRVRPGEWPARDAKALRKDPRDSWPVRWGSRRQRRGYWCALHGASRLRRYTPTGAVDRDIALPVSQPTMCAFAGESLNGGLHSR